VTVIQSEFVAELHTADARGPARPRTGLAGDEPRRAKPYRSRDAALLGTNPEAFA
jgi:hypothetical protein